VAEGEVDGEGEGSGDGGGVGESVCEGGASCADATETNPPENVSSCSDSTRATSVLKRSVHRLDRSLDISLLPLSHVSRISPEYGARPSGGEVQPQMADSVFRIVATSPRQGTRPMGTFPWSNVPPFGLRQRAL
jgi:hypothetical protein